MATKQINLKCPLCQVPLYRIEGVGGLKVKTYCKRCGCWVKPRLKLFYIPGDFCRWLTLDEVKLRLATGTSQAKEKAVALLENEEE